MRFERPELLNCHEHILIERARNNSEMLKRRPRLARAACDDFAAKLVDLACCGESAAKLVNPQYKKFVHVFAALAQP